MDFVLPPIRTRRSAVEASLRILRARPQGNPTQSVDRLRAGDTGRSEFTGGALYDDRRARQGPRETTAKLTSWYQETVDRNARSGQSGEPEARLASVLEAGSRMKEHPQAPCKTLIVAVFALVCAACPTCPQPKRCTFRRSRCRLSRMRADRSPCK